MDMDVEFDSKVVYALHKRLLCLPYIVVKFIYIQDGEVVNEDLVYVLLGDNLADVGFKGIVVVVVVIVVEPQVVVNPRVNLGGYLLWRVVELVELRLLVAVLSGGLEVQPSLELTVTQFPRPYGTLVPKVRGVEDKL